MSDHPATHEDQTLRQELADTRRKLQEYADTVVSLHGELRSLRDAICNSCKRKFVPLQAQAAELRVSSSVVIPRPSKRTFSWRRLLKLHGSDHISRGSGPPISKIPSASDISQTFLSMSFPIWSTPAPALPTTIHGNSDTPVSTPQRPITLKTVPSLPRWYAQPNATANAGLSVTFVRGFIHKGEVRSVRFSPDGKHLAAVLSKGDKNVLISIHNVETGDKHCELEESASQYTSIKVPHNHCGCFSPSGRYLVVGDRTGRVIVWDIPTKRIRNIFRGHSNSRVESLDISPNGRHVVSASWDVRLLNTRDGSTRVLTDNTRIFCSITFSPNSRFVVAGDAVGIMRAWDVRTGQLIWQWTGHEHSVRSVTFTPDGRGLVSGGYRGVVKCWDVSSLGVVESGGRLVPTKILDRTSTVNAVAVSSDGDWIASGLSDETTVIWDAHSSIRQCTLIGHVKTICSVDFSPAGSYLASGSRDGHIALWRYTGTCIPSV